MSPKEPPQLAVTLVRELPRLAVSLVAVAAAFLFEHFVVHRFIVLPSIDGGNAAPWIWVGLVAPELLVGFATGWRLRSRAAAVMYAGMAALVREGCQLALSAAGEPGHAADRRLVEIATSTPAVATAYLIAILLASSLARETEIAEGRARADAAADDERR